MIFTPILFLSTLAVAITSYQGHLAVNNKPISFRNSGGDFYFLDPSTSIDPASNFTIETGRCSTTTGHLLNATSVPNYKFMAHDGGYYYAIVSATRDGWTEAGFRILCNGTVEFPASFVSTMLWTEDFGAISGELAERGNKQANVTFVPSNDPISNCFYSTDPFAVKCDNLFRATACSGTFTPDSNGKCVCAAGTYQNNNQTCVVCPDVHAATCSSPVGATTTCKKSFTLNASSKTCACPDGQFAANTTSSTCATCPSPNAATCDNSGTLTTCKPTLQLVVTAPDYASCLLVNAQAGKILRLIR